VGQSSGVIRGGLGLVGLLPPLLQIHRIHIHRLGSLSIQVYTFTIQFTCLHIMLSRLASNSKKQRSFSSVNPQTSDIICIHPLVGWCLSPIDVITPISSPNFPTNHGTSLPRSHLHTLCASIADLKSFQTTADMSF